MAAVLLLRKLPKMLNSYSMKNQTSGALIAPEPAGIHVSENLKALNEQVSNIQHRYYRVLAPDCEIKTEADCWYFRAIVWACAAMVFPPLLAAAAKGVRHEQT